mmetsp:Transcript_6412/g.14776  ORF Transcript_6412/g.14776 Transcript_6412/m.14776 type:complete len:366 (-) Transcript_6412:1224-2321(-)
MGIDPGPLRRRRVHDSVVLEGAQPLEPSADPCLDLELDVLLQRRPLPLDLSRDHLLDVPERIRLDLPFDRRAEPFELRLDADPDALLVEPCPRPVEFLLDAILYHPVALDARPVKRLLPLEVEVRLEVGTLPFKLVLVYPVELVPELLQCTSLVARVRPRELLSLLPEGVPDGHGPVLIGLDLGVDEGILHGLAQLADMLRLDSFEVLLVLLLLPLAFVLLSGQLLPENVELLVDLGAGVRPPAVVLAGTGGLVGRRVLLVNVLKEPHPLPREVKLVPLRISPPSPHHGPVVRLKSVVQPTVPLLPRATVDSRDVVPHEPGPVILAVLVEDISDAGPSVACRVVVLLDVQLVVPPRRDEVLRYPL